MSDPRQMVQLDEPVDLSRWDREPIHTPGEIQPHGVFFALRNADFTITQVSESVRDLIGVEPDEVLGRGISHVIGDELVGPIHRLLEQDFRIPLAIGDVGVKIGPMRPTFEALAHRAGERVILELEPAEGDWPQQTLQMLMGAAMTQLRQTRDLDQICDLTAEHAMQITGFDRVMVLRFERLSNLQVVAERVTEGMPSFKGQYFPASDYPRPLRELFRVNPLRIIPDVNAGTSPMTPVEDPDTREPLDMSFAVLRAVWPVQIEYLRNMGVAASMEISLLVGGKPWGLIVCHHRTPRYLPYPVRALAELLAQLAAVQIELLETESTANNLSRYRLAHAGLSELMAQERDVLAAMINRQPSLLNALDADGAALFGRGETHLAGTTPTPEQVAQLAAWLDRQGDPLYHTDRLGEVFPPAKAYKDIASGLFTARLQSNPTTYMLWFRGEKVRRVIWAGNPRRPVEVDDEGTLHARRDFSPHEEIIHGTSDPWHPHEEQATHELRISLQDVLSRRWRELEELESLKRSNEALEAFASIISHDLREPLAGIQIYLQLLEESARDKLDENQRNRLSVCRRFATQASEMVARLLHFSRAANVELAFQLTDLNQAVDAALELVRPLVEQSRVDVRIPRPLPSVVCDRSAISEVFVNLLTNAIKYNDQPQKWIEIGYVGEAIDTAADTGKHDPPVIYVRDNGIGIDPADFEMVFQMFRRVQSHNPIATGTGVGLAIVKAIIERHRGKIWIESNPGEGSTFYFTLRAK